MLSDPDVIAALQCWWDETHSFAVGVTSGVICDMLEEKGYDSWDGYGCDLRDVMRGRTGYVSIDDDTPGRFHAAAGVFQLRRPPRQNRQFRHLVDYLAAGLAAAGESVPDAYIILGWEAVRLLAHTREMIDFIYYGLHPYDALDHRTGLPKYYMGFKLIVSDVQPEWQINGACRDTIITARIVA